MRQWCSVGVCALLLPGCILSTEQCGLGFVEEDGRCVLEEAPPPYYTDGGVDLALPDASGPDAAPAPQPPPDPPPPVPDPEPEPAFNPWADRVIALVVDRSDRGDARNTPTSPGYDLDALILIDEIGDLVGFGGTWENAQINDPFGRNLSRDPAGSAGEPDAVGLSEPGRYTSLGADGGYVTLRLEIFEPLRPGMAVVLFEMEEDRNDERAEVYLCLDGPLDLSLCRTAGEALGTSTLPLTE